MFLLFTLYAPMGSMGEVACGERRMSWARPAQSAVMGLVGATMGYAKTNPANMELVKGLFYAVRTDVAGQPLMDYHTTQTPKQKGRTPTFDHRRHQLRSAELHTVLSVREWHQDPFFTVALWPRSHQPKGFVTEDLLMIAKAMSEPFFVPYLGRKAGVLGLPLNPQVVEADTLLEALDLRSVNPMEAAVLEAFQPGPARELAFDIDAEGAPWPHDTQIRRDTPISRQRWQFGYRTEGIYNYPIQEQPED